MRRAEMQDMQALIQQEGGFKPASGAFALFDALIHTPPHLDRCESKNQNRSALEAFGPVNQGDQKQKEPKPKPEEKPKKDDPPPPSRPGDRGSRRPKRPRVGGW